MLEGCPNHGLAFRRAAKAQWLGLAVTLSACTGLPPPGITPLATGQTVTPTLVRGAVQQALNPRLHDYPDFVAGQAVRCVLSPDGKTLAVLTAGQNSLVKPDGSVDAAASTQFIFLYDVAGERRSHPRLTQVIQQLNAHVGLAFSPGGKQLYAAGGADDAVYVYARQAGTWAAAGRVGLGHADHGLGLGVRPNAAGLAVSSDGRTLVVANNYNDSISVIDTATQRVRYEHDLRPWFGRNEGLAGRAGGSFPFAVVVKGNATAYVSSDRDREVVVVDISSPVEGHLLARIKLDGNALGMALDRPQARLYVAQDNADEVAIIDTASNAVTARIDARAPPGMLAGAPVTGVATFGVTLSPDGRTLYAVNAGANSIAVIPLTGPRANTVAGLIPTAYEPHDLRMSADGGWMYIVNGKSATGPNPGHLTSSTARMTRLSVAGGAAAAARAARASNQYQFQMERASLVSTPVPTASELATLTEAVARNDFYDAAPIATDVTTMAFLHRHIRHVIYVVKENRTYDQDLGDLPNGANGDARLTQFGAGLTPNNHRLAGQFVTLDNFMNPGDGSMDGWSWALQGRVTNTETITQQINYAAVDRGLSYESEGTNRNVPVNLATPAERDAALGPAGATNYSQATAGLPGGTANLLAGTGNHASTDAPFGIQKGSIFSAVLHAGLSVRNYGFLVHNVGSIGTSAAPLSRPFDAGIAQVVALDPELAPLTDLYFRGFDQHYPDLWRIDEWKREFDVFVAQDRLPSLSLVRISHDHMGAFGSALAGVNTPETQQADCDLALGRLVEAVAASPFARDTLIIVTEDDVQDGPDHVDSHRGPALVIGPYVRRSAVVSTRYSQVNALRTIEDILGTPHINLNTATQGPMTQVFDIRASGDWQYRAVASTVLKTTSLLPDGGIPFARGPDLHPRHAAAYWDEVTAGFDFRDADQVPPDAFNRILWAGLRGREPYPGRVGPASGADDDE